MSAPPVHSFSSGILISSAPILPNASNITISNATFNDVSRQQINNYNRESPSDVHVLVSLDH